MNAAALALLLSAPARASEFVEALRRADARAAEDPERVEYAARAIRAWTREHGGRMLAHAHLRRGEGELARHDDEAAERDFTRALELDPGASGARSLRARARMALGLWKGAESDYRERAESAPEDGEAWLGLGEARARRGPPHSDRPALEALREARARLPGDPRPLAAEGLAQLASGRPLKALESLDAAVEAGGGSLNEALALRARVKLALRDPKGSRADATRALPSFERRLEERRRTKAPPRAEAAARAALAELLFRRALASEMLGESAGALEDHRRGCELDYPPCCAKAETLAPKPAAPAPKPARKRRRPSPKSDPGERIYAN